MVFKITMKHLDKNMLGKNDELPTELHKYEVFLDKKPSHKQINQALEILEGYKTAGKFFSDYWGVFLTIIENMGYEIQEIESTTIEVY
ncbi:hypothetical protein ES708_29865 [subsurface metagenome]